MNDASAEGVEANSNPNPDDHPNDQPHLDPSRWWFASSAFPMIAGTLGPIASAFSICALSRPWRQYYPPNTDVDTAAFIDDPVWLTAVNGVQLIIAIVANMALLLNMARRLRFSVAQPVTIIGWYISAISLIALTATAAGPLVIQPADEYIWSQAFYYGIYSACLYFVVASLMVVTFLGAHNGHYPKDFVLTPSQRTLMLQTIMFLLYLLLGALVFSKIEGWNYLDAVYWAAVTLFTVGFGDFYATTILGRALVLPFSLVGIISLGLVIGSIRSMVLDRGRRRLNARVLEKKRRQMIREILTKGKDDILIPIQEAQTAPTRTTSALTEFQRREEEFKLMRKIQEVAARKRRWYAMGISTGSWLILWLVGARIFQDFEKPYQGWTYFDGVYFTYVSLTTIGYGDITPVSNGGKSFWVFWALLALPTMTVLISNAGDTIVKVIREGTDRVATVTILPGERGFKKDLKRLLRMLSCGILFEEDIDDSHETAPGFLGGLPEEGFEGNVDDDVEADLERDENDLAAEGAAPSAVQEKQASDAKGEDVHDKRVRANAQSEGANNGLTSKDDESRPVHPDASKPPRSSLQPTSSAQLLKITRAASFPRQALPDIPANKAEYHVTLIEEIGRVTQHLKSHPPRKYTFHEWAWYLRLIGEDEGDADKHHTPKAHTRDHKTIGHRLHKKRPAGYGEGRDGDEERHKDGSWSWVGARSPLMGSLEEAEWVLEKLTERLTEELRGVSRGRRESSSMYDG